MIGGVVTRARFDASNCAAFAELSGAVCCANNTPGTWRISAMSRPKMRACSGREADANSKRSLDALRARQRLIVLISRTPARSGGQEYGSSIWACAGSGEWFRSGTKRNHFENRYCVEFVWFSRKFRWFRHFGQSLMRARVHARTRVWGLVGFGGTAEPIQFIYISHRFVGSVVVPQWFRCGTSPVLPGGAAVELDILGGGYCAGILGSLDAVSIGGSNSQNLGSAAKSFRVFAWSAAAPRNGGILRFSSARSGHVGRIVLEGSAQRRGNAPFAGAGRKPSRLARRAPPCPHSRLRRSLSWSRSTVAGFGSTSRSAPSGVIKISADQARPLRRGAKVGVQASGRGWGGELDHGAQAPTGRGVALDRWRLVGPSAGRIKHARGGLAHVN